MVGSRDYRLNRRRQPESLALCMAAAIVHRSPTGRISRRSRRQVWRRGGSVSSVSMTVANRFGMKTAPSPSSSTASSSTIRKEGLADRAGPPVSHVPTPEILVHLWEEHGEAMFGHLRGQFAFALWDSRKRTIILGRDRLGIVPLHWARRGDTVYFGSEIKAILASGGVEPKADPRGLDHIFTTFSMATRRTAFAGVSAIHPASYLRIQLQPGQVAS